MKSSRTNQILSTLVSAFALACPASAWATDLTMEIDAPLTAAPGDNTSFTAAVTANQVQGEYVYVDCILTGPATITQHPTACTGDEISFFCDLGSVPADTSVSLDTAIAVDPAAALDSEIEISCSSEASNEINPGNNGASLAIVVGESSGGCDPACGEYEVCTDGECLSVEDYCEPECAEDEVCIDSQCIAADTPCDPVCGEGEVCEAGYCTAEPEVSSGGCSLGASGSSRAGLLLPLAMALLALRRRQPRAGGS